MILASVSTTIPCYSGENHECVTVGEILQGDFQKYIKNNSIICLKDLKITEKAETFLHYTHKKSNN